MVLLTIGAQLLDTLIIKTTAFALTQSLNVITWGSSSLYYYYMGKPLTELEKIELEVARLKNEIKLLKNGACGDDPSDDLGVIAMD